MTIIALDDTDSRTLGMCTTYVGHLVTRDLEDAGYNIYRTLLIRLNPAAKHKTRGNAAIAIHTDAPADLATETAWNRVSTLSADSDEMTNPSVVVSPTDEIPDEVSDFTDRAIKSLLDIEEAEELIENNGFLSRYLGNGRGRIGCVAAIGAWNSLDDWTYERIAYRYPEPRGTERQVDVDSVFDEADNHYPDAWDTVDRTIGSPICTPNAPGPILYGIRGDSKDAVETMAREIKNEEDIESYHTFVTNQGTDAHIVEVENIEDMSNNTAYKVRGTVSEEPKNREGGHVEFEISDETSDAGVIAFEPTKHFRKKIRELREGDIVEVLGEYDNGFVKIEKMNIVELNRTKLVNPKCPDCGNSMASAGRDQGYRCRDCKNETETKEEIVVNREIETGWHEVPPCARRHISKPLVRGDFSGNVHPYK